MFHLDRRPRMVLRMGSEGIDIGTYIALGGAIFAGIALIFNALSLRRSAKNESLKLIRDYQNEIFKLDRSNDQKYKSSQDTSERYKYELWGVEYLNLHDQIAHFALKGYITEDVAQYFNRSFEKALKLLDDNPFNSDYYKSKFLPIRRWCDKQRI
jgi:hypothetical protein